MPIIINCPACQKAYRVDDSVMGKSMRCNACKTPFIAGEKASFDDPTPAAITPPSPRFLCPSCGSTLEVPKGVTRAVCPDCATVTSVELANQTLQRVPPSSSLVMMSPSRASAAIPQPPIGVNLNYRQPRNPAVLLVGVGVIVVLAIVAAGLIWRMNRNRTAEDLVVRNVEKETEKAGEADRIERESRLARIREHRFWSSPVNAHKVESILHSIIETNAGNTLWVERDGRMWRGTPESFLDRPKGAILEFAIPSDMTKRMTMDEASRLLLTELDRAEAKFGPGR